MDYISLFAGIGGFEYGMHQSKYKDELNCVGYSEIDKYATQIYEKNFPNHRALGDVTEINTEELPDFDLLVGGFPCQAFSIAGLRKGFDDTRGTLFFEIARILHDKRPRHFLLENVKGLLSHERGETFKTIIRVLSEMGYDVEWEVFNSKNYGVPQNRERVYIKGHLRGDRGGQILSDNRTGESYNKRIKQEYIYHRAYRLCEKDGVVGTLTASGRNGGPHTIIKVGNFSPSNHRGRQVISTDGVSQTLTAGVYKNGIYIRNEKKEGPEQYEYRKMTPVECERLQGFPDNWTEYGADGKKISNTQRYKCLGNAVTTNVVKHIFDNWDLW